ncbi:MAG: hypothetical protein R3F11_02585 [Verrucomicrobiales bacterium]
MAGVGSTGEPTVVGADGVRGVVVGEDERVFGRWSAAAENAADGRRRRARRGGDGVGGSCGG